MLLPTWIVDFANRRPRLDRPLTLSDYGQIEVAALDRDGAAAAFRQRYPRLHIKAIYVGSPTGFA